MKTIVCLVCLMILEGGCARAWYNPNRSLKQCRQDFLECNYEAVKASYTPHSYWMSPTSAGMQEGFQKVNVCGSCMQARGYGLIPVKQLPEGVRQAPTSYGSWYIAGR